MDSPRDTSSIGPALAAAPTRDSAGSVYTPAIITDEVPEETISLYLLKWSDTEVNKTQVRSVAQLRSDIQDNSNSTRHLFVLHGLPMDYTVTLRELGDADASFLDAHAGRRSYRSLRRPKAGWAHYDYPELVCQSGFHEGREHEVVAKDLIGDPPTYVTSRTGRSVIFCRASIWLSEKVHILYLDRPVWERPESGVSRMRYEVYTPEKNSSITTISQLDLHDSLTAVGNEIPTLEEMLCGSLRDGCSSRQGLLELLEDLAINKWGNFFETLSLDSSVGSNETTALFLQTLNCLERNLDVSRRRYEIECRSIDARQDENTQADMRSRSARAEWEALLARCNRHAELLSHLGRAAANTEIPMRRSGADRGVVAGLGISSTGAGGGDDKLNHRSRNDHNTCTNSAPDENQRALDRVVYLGGALLPFSIVSGILAIEEPFGPGDPQFWIFWAVTGPLVLVTLAVIYADSIRKAEVWKEVTVSGRSASDTTSDPVLVGSSLVVDVEQALPAPRSRFFAFVREKQHGDEPDQIVEKRWKTAVTSTYGARSKPDDSEWARDKRWRKEELGWVGAFATLLRLYKLKKGVPPSHLRCD